MSYPHLNNFKSTFIEWIETNDLYFKVAIKSHLPVDIFTKCCLSCCRTTSYSDDYLLWWLLNQTFLSLFVNLCVHFLPQDIISSKAKNVRFIISFVKLGENNYSAQEVHQNIQKIIFAFLGHLEVLYYFLFFLDHLPKMFF